MSACSYKYIYIYIYIYIYNISNGQVLLQKGLGMLKDWVTAENGVRGYQPRNICLNVDAM